MVDSIGGVPPLPPLGGANYAPTAAMYNALAPLWILFDQYGGTPHAMANSPQMMAIFALSVNNFMAQTQDSTTQGLANYISNMVFGGGKTLKSICYEATSNMPECISDLAMNSSALQGAFSNIQQFTSSWYAQYPMPSSITQTANFMTEFKQLQTDLATLQTNYGTSGPPSSTDPNLAAFETQLFIVSKDIQKLQNMTPGNGYETFLNYYLGAPLTPDGNVSLDTIADALVAADAAGKTDPMDDSTLFSYLFDAKNFSGWGLSNIPATDLLPGGWIDGIMQYEANLPT